ncbi:cation diffusion facilitator family transporter [Adlercreutzia aquisgranensis]|uniref:cation diffusion facilitator family transporter n=1 Tax=Adlercreutzia aquisgranensis TaxID=2941323 RepID=UPI00204102D6|nr:cation diffusion facilitator family transporter [Adlercreutzia aquisgranensis]
MLVKPNPSNRLGEVRRVLWLVLFLNLAVAAAKFAWGTLSGSASMQADGIHSAFDSVGNVVALFGIAVASRPADAGHPYGHSKFEAYASVAIGCLLLAAALSVGSSAVSRLVSGGGEVEVTPVSFAVMVGTLGVNLAVTAYERAVGKRLRSEVLRADAAHTFSDALVSVGVIAGLAFVWLGFPVADSVMALVVTVAILATAFSVLRQALSTLSDHARIPRDELEAVVLSCPGVRHTHKIRTRGTEGEVYADLHLLVDPAMTVQDAHNLGDRVEAALKEAFPQIEEVLVHIEPDDGHKD